MTIIATYSKAWFNKVVSATVLSTAWIAELANATVLSSLWRQSLAAGGAGFSVGDIKSSVLNETTFQGINGTSWVLMDGRDITGSDLHQVSGNSNIPDTRGEFLRGNDNGRGADSGRFLGSFQGDSFRSHTHTFAHYRSNGANRTYGGLNGRATDPDYGATFTGVSYVGGSETRPRNISVNFFIKINW